MLEAAGGELSKKDLHKLLLLYTEETSSPHYAFVPYKFGGYSFLCNDDLDLLEKRGWVKEEKESIFLEHDLQKFAWVRNSEEHSFVKRWAIRNKLRGDDLIAESYRRFPYYALNSEIKNELLNKEELDAVETSVKEITKKGIKVFTLGYEGIHFEDYLNKLIRNHISTLCDVRRNPLSRKFGFSSRKLSTVLPTLGIEYKHFPELGIESEKRKHLDSYADYKDLFSVYRDELPSRQEGIDRLVKTIVEKKRVALTCFEAHHKSCHRHCISDLLGEKFGLPVVHL
jgi:hypothetical protein